jgi:transglutaminase-like putative cysteine protease
MKEYLQATEVIDWQDSQVWALAKQLGAAGQAEAVAKACFEWVREFIDHTVDYERPQITCCASEVLRDKTGFCYGKSHLLAALLRANQIPAGFCYQRLSVNGDGEPYCLHGFNAVYLPRFGWYRIDARGNRSGIDAQFTPPQERLAYQPASGELEFKAIFPNPLIEVVQALQTHCTLEAFSANFPNRSAELENSKFDRAFMTGV